MRHRGLIFLANSALIDGDDDQARSYAESALEASQAEDDAWRTIESLDVLARVAQARGNWSGAYGRHREAVVAYAEPHGLPGAAMLEAQLALQATRMRDATGADRHAGRALRLARRYGLRSLEGWVRYTQAMGRMVGGDHESAIRYIDQGYEIFDSIGDVDRQAVGFLLAGMVEESRGDRDAAASWNRRSLQHGRSAAKAVTVSLALLGMAVDHHRRDDDETATVILGAVEAAHRRTRFSVPAYVPNSDLMATLQGRLGDVVWLAARERGAEMTLDEAVDLALS